MTGYVQDPLLLCDGKLISLKKLMKMIDKKDLKIERSVGIDTLKEAYAKDK